MRLPAIQGVIDRRILVNYRVDPQVASRLLPPPFRPKLAAGHAIAGICLIRLKQVRPALLPGRAGFESENAAHRFAVEWDANGATQTGVFIPRRDTNSRISVLLGGRVFPGEHHHANFQVSETDDALHVGFASDDGVTCVTVTGRLTEGLPPGSCFASVNEASRFFEDGSLGYSATRDPARFDGLELRCKSWSVRPLAIEAVQSSYFDDPNQFPPGSAVFDCALLMRNIEHEWHSREDLCCAAM